LCMNPESHTFRVSFDFSYGLPTLPKLDGLTPLVEIYGKGANRFPLLVTFQYPFDWVVVTPNNDANSEAGTISAGEYAKGDSATLFVNPSSGNVKVRIRRHYVWQRRHLCFRISRVRTRISIRTPLSRPLVKRATISIRTSR
jgi:hypothetical protein